MKWKEGRIDVSALWKKYRFVILVILAGVVLMLLPAHGGEQEGHGEELSGRETFSLERVEARMEEILGQIEGAGKLQLMLTLQSGSQLQLAEDTDLTAAADEQRSERSTVTLNRGSGVEDIVVTRQIYPIYQGAVVVCQGADNAAVRLALTEAVCALTGLSSDKVSIVKWNS